MDDLTAFVTARLDEDEARANAMGHYIGDDEDPYYSCPATRTGPLGDLEWGEDHCDCGLAERKGRALREVEAKRAILRIHEPGYPAVARQEPPGPSTVADPGGIVSTFPYCVTCDEDSPCSTLQYLATIWNDHADYRPEWAQPSDT